MSQTQFLLFLISIIPFANCLIIHLCADAPKLVSFANKASPILFLVILTGLYGSAYDDDSYLVLIEASRGLSIGFAPDQMAMGFLLMLGVFWIIFVFYSQRFFQLTQTQNLDHFQTFFTLIIGFVSLVVLSKNLLSILFFYNCLVFLCHFFAIKFLHKKSTKFSHIFTFLLYLESIFLFLAIVATYKFTGKIDFSSNGIIAESLSPIKQALLLIFYSSGLFLSILFPSYLLYREANFDTPIIYVLFFLAYAFSSFYIFIKLISFIFGFNGFSELISNIGFEFFEIIFLANIFAASLFLMKSKGLRSSFFYLFFQQFLFTLFVTILFAKFLGAKAVMPIISYFLSFTLVFLTISNFILYLSKAENKGLEGLFYDLKVTSILLIFGILSLIGIAPSLAAVNSFFLIKLIFQKKLLISAIIFLINLGALSVLALKIIYPLFLKPEQPRSQADLELAKNIDFDSNLILTSLVVGIMLLLSLIVYPFVINFFSL
jgi:formate hydrogenlyase subunit 3/multisubunit Na+/H+ antiporter MnhD subunit